ncbi:MAG: hypothetical protein KC912_05735 [Proteobacteria bacterium]|nr:hypothetical protein [Pseudomonadota bacterium]
MRLIFAASLFALGVACELGEPCDRYVDYMCDCHVSASECDQLRAELAGADPDIQDQCAIDLSQQEAQDDDDGVVCEVSPF